MPPNSALSYSALSWTPPIALADCYADPTLVCVLQVQARGIAALASLTCYDDRRRWLLISEGALQATIAAMHAYPKRAHIQEAGSFLICCLISLGEGGEHGETGVGAPDPVVCELAANLGAFSVVAQALRLHPERSGVLQWASTAALRMSFQHVERGKLAIDAGCAAALRYLTRRSQVESLVPDVVRASLELTHEYLAMQAEAARDLSA